MRPDSDFGMLPRVDERHEACLVERVFGRAPSRPYFLSLAQKEDGLGRAEGLFEIRGEIGHHVGTLRSITSSEVHSLARAVIRLFNVRAVLFEDCLLTRDSQPMFELSACHFRYKANWRCVVAPGAKYLSHRQQRALDKKRSRLTEYLGAEPQHIFRRAKPRDIDLVESLNRKRVESRGRRYEFTPVRRHRLKEVSELLGYTSVLIHDDRVIAGCIIYVKGTQAYFAIQGFDAEFQKYSPGVLLHLLTLDACADLGCHEASFLWGDGRWKSDLGAKRECLDTVLVSRNAYDLVHPESLRLMAPHAKASARYIVRCALKGLYSAKEACLSHLTPHVRTGAGGRK